MYRWIAVIAILVEVLNVSSTPVVLWHGMGDTCCMPYSLGYFKIFLQKQLPGLYVHSLEIGNSNVQDLEHSFFMSPNKQVQYACDKLAQDPKLADGFNAIGFSQGGQFLRALVQRCGHKLRMKNLITLGGQHQGVYGIPHCGALKHKSCDYVRKMIKYAAYTSYVQDSLVQATYWHDPLNEDLYKAKSMFLADINNELTVNKTYIDNLNTLQNFVMVKFDNDTIVQPPETEWFGYYLPGQAKELLTLQQSSIYMDELLGLKKMDEDGKLVFLSTPGDHLQFNTDWFIKKIVQPYLAK